MRKGDARREQIMATAETLFYQKGYEQTSVQDILDALQFSKGGFYLHFESKLALLSAICEQRAQESYEAAQAAVAACAGDPVAQLNALTDSGGLWRTDRLDYIGLLLRVAYREDGALMRERLKQSTLELMLPLMNGVIAAGVESGVFVLPRASLAGELVLRLTAQFTDEVALALARGGDESEQLSDILSRLELYRHTIERMLGAPFGSVTLYDMQHLAAVCRGIAGKM